MIHAVVVISSVYGVPKPHLRDGAAPDGCFTTLRHQRHQGQSGRDLYYRGHCLYHGGRQQQREVAPVIWLYVQSAFDGLPHLVTENSRDARGITGCL